MQLFLKYHQDQVKYYNGKFVPLIFIIDMLYMWFQLYFYDLIILETNFQWEDID